VWADEEDDVIPAGPVVLGVTKCFAEQSFDSVSFGGISDGPSDADADARIAHFVFGDAHPDLPSPASRAAF